MRFKFIRPIGQEKRDYNHHPDLIKSIIPYLEKRGHSVSCSIQTADVVIFDSEIWDRHDNDPSLPKGSYSPYDPNDLRIIMEAGLPIVFFDSFDHHGTPTHFCTWPGKNNWEDAKDSQDWGRFMYQAKDRCKVIYFMRKMQLSAPYPDWVYPLEYPLFNDFGTVSKDELCNRPNDICFLGETGWIRENAIRDIKADGRLKADLEHIPCNKRLEFDAWVARHRRAKMFLEIDNSMGSERPQRLMTVAAMLRVRSDHRLPFPRKDMNQMVEIGDYDGHVKSRDIDKVLQVINDPDLLYLIYVHGMEHMKTYYSMDARNNYIIDTIERALSKS